MKNLEIMGVQEMDAKEMRIKNGGGILAFIAIAGAYIYLYNNWDDFKAGYKAGLALEELPE